MNLYKQFKTSNEAEASSGVVLNYGHGQKITILRAGGTNNRYYEAIRKHSVPGGEMIRVVASDKDAVENLAKVYADGIVIGWEGIADEQNVPLAFTRENVIKVLVDLPELFADIREAAGNAALFREALKADLLGKSSATTGGN